MRNLIILKTIFKLGIKNIFLLSLFKLLKISKFYYLYTPINNCKVNKFHYRSIKNFYIDKSWFEFSKKKYINFMHDINNKKYYYFNFYKTEITNPPEWFLDPFEKVNYESFNKHWSSINENKISDFKNIWELSRWNWATVMARSWKISGNKNYLDQLNNWMEDWCKHNPVNNGFNWICGQEASIRLINYLITWKIINNKNEQILLDKIDIFVLQHLDRISKTILYAQSQDNNHWVSEASALFIGGIWLNNFTSHKKKGNLFARKGRQNLERALKKLIMRDGSFSQYSVNYHRFLIDTLIQVELWRAWLNQDLFSEDFYSHCKSASLWLSKFINSESGEPANIGGNDGVFCYQLHNLGYHNFKPSVQLSFIVFFKEYIYDDGPWDEPLYWLRICKNDFTKKKLKNNHFEFLKNGGFALMRFDPYFLAIFRIPIHQFRPSQADPFHFDLWVNGLNLLRDGGTYTYSNNNNFLQYFSGVKSHNTIEFDGKEPMYRISRFLWGNWLNVSEKDIFIKQDQELTSVEATYKCKYGTHKRKIMFIKKLSQIHVTDHISGFKKKATIRWRLAPLKWEINGLKVKNKNIEFSFFSNRKIENILLKKGFESNNYNHIEEIPVIEITIHKAPCKFKTIIETNHLKK